MKNFFSFLVFISFLFMANESAKALTFTVNVPAGTKYCFIAGEMNNWNPTAHQMTKVEGADQFTIDISYATETQKYKYCGGPGWAYEEKAADGTNPGDRTWTTLDVVQKWASEFIPDDRTVTIQALVPKEVLVLYLVGVFNNWSGDFKNSPYLMDFVSEGTDGKIYTIDVTWVDAFNMEFKFVAGPDWTFEQTETTNYKFGTTENIAYFDVKKFKSIFDPTKAGDITVTATVPAGTNRVWIQGSFAGWNWDNPDPLEMTKQENGTFTYTVPNVVSFEYRLYNLPDWSHPEVGEADPTADLSNRIAIFEENPNVNITVWAWKVDLSSIPSIDKNNFKVYSVDKQIIVEGLFSQVDIYDLAGRPIQSANVSGKFTSKSLNTGAYIIKVDGVVKKALVR